MGITLSIMLFVIISKKIDNFLYNKSSEGLGWNSKYITSEKVFEAARIFSNGASKEEIKELLQKCIDLDIEDIEEILSCIQNTKIDNESRYSYFLKVVNNVLGVEAYVVT